jgi:hypothetical protein
MKKIILMAGLAMGLLMLGLANIASASFYFHYDASVKPDDPSLANVFSTAVFPSTSWSASGGKLTLTTAYLQGIWFGNDSVYDPVPWQLGNSSQGNSLSMIAKLLPNSEDWEAYILDGSYFARMRFFPGELRMNYSGGESSFALDTLAFHTYSLSLIDGVVTYSVDGAKVFSENALAYPYGKYLIIGDGTAPSNRTTGSFVIDDVIINAAPVPIPSAGLLFGTSIAGLAIIRLRRKKQ